MDLQKAFDAGFEAVKSYVDGAFEDLERRLAAVEQRTPSPGRDGDPGMRGERGEPGPAGRDGTIGAPGRSITKSMLDKDGHLILTYSDGSTDDVGLIVGKDGRDGRDGKDGADGAPGEKGADGINGRDGTDGKPGEKGLDGADGRKGEDGKPGLDGKNGADGRNGLDGQDGKSLELEAVADLVRAEVQKASIEELVQKAVDAIPRPLDGVNGKDGAPGEKGEKGDAGEPGKEGPPGRDGKDGTPGEKGVDGKDGRDGAPGKLPLAKAWTDAVHREGEVVTHEGGTYQAERDTGKAPPHADWICLAAPGRSGKDADEFDVRGTYDPDGSYKRLSIVALNGGAFISRKDTPGICPGEDWQQIAMRGKSGPPGEARKGDPGIGIKGDPGPRVEQMSVDGQGMLTLINADGSAVQCDLYPVLLKISG